MSLDHPDFQTPPNKLERPSGILPLPISGLWHRTWFGKTFGLQWVEVDMGQQWSWRDVNKHGSLGKVGSLFLDYFLVDFIWFYFLQKKTNEPSQIAFRRAFHVTWRQQTGQPRTIVDEIALDILGRFRKALKGWDRCMEWELDCFVLFGLVWFCLVWFVLFCLFWFMIFVLGLSWLICSLLMGLIRVTYIMLLN